MTLFYEGFSLMLIGMGTVFAFLSLLVVVISLVSKFILRYFPENEPSVAPVSSSHDERLVAVISAAVNRYRKSKK
ncbi:MAG: OadG family protein [Gammaproteobacteria bacterium]|nr:OadG family protein [Gammaproteobacteria bacterium]